MANFTRAKGSGWADQDPLTHDQINQIDEALPKLPNFAEGSSHSPTAPVVVTGANGLDVEYLTGRSVQRILGLLTVPFVDLVVTGSLSVTPTKTLYKVRGALVDSAVEASATITINNGTQDGQIIILAGELAIGCLLIVQGLGDTYFTQFDSTSNPGAFSAILVYSTSAARWYHVVRHFGGSV